MTSDRRKQMETPYLPLSIFGNDFKNVYEPAEDTFLLLDALELDLSYLMEITSICLELGSGSGTICTALSKAFNSDSDQILPTDTSCETKAVRLIFATDVNSQACETTKKCAQYHGQNNIQVIRTNLAECLIDRFENMVDLLVFNPPYVPTDDEEQVESSQLQLAWAGGANGRKLIDTFLRFYVPRLLSKPFGVAYMVALESNNIDELLNYLVSDYEIQGTVVLKRQAGAELLHIIRYNWITSSSS